MPGNFNAIPESVLQSWPKPNYIDPIRRGWMPAFALTWQIASTLLVAGRFYLRAKKQAGSFGLDDLMIFIGWLFSVGFTALAWIGAERFDLDRHTWDVHTTLYVGTALTGWIAQVLFILSTVPTKLSVLLFYRRMAKDSLDRRWLYAIYLALSVTAAYGLAIFLTYCLICHPLSAYWESYDFSYDKPFTCIDGNALTLTSGILSVLSDCYAVALPCLMLRHYSLDVPRKQKIVLNVIFGLGFLYVPPALPIPHSPLN
ncbi:hypothetical protein M409DRAFT_48556 [Zasmidium cellare ATCC 36951]|uniref:Rhodopsin domain-containing protein n=1 Tax=Zasmidium cellare ATCC 36951 TaxID=1080233 RepID=A0A6A6D2J5_ZASCE|nr:uncharacterized protein M409DRAFT_48556 [Zasmidium cellare ATCC 36951]KAF2173601.1 hypothetical protein M409DRAFT_48556 [Zasmidium cellare ATCC 36951]